ncbi:threonine aldolase family protein [Rubrimonas cliftonensis]|uniref:L-threonine aldolase n=1 Tax=Rubrimonas cliftonensis TaxID=89524 RepID=A0A1H3XGU1_9RHOB|nr:beta-eliminating lyase-related protein [Rubrimonas cliftonensis]SDZ98430.1 L-threonine aldolase [Rubrimonas cliftonensis]
MLFSSDNIAACAPEIMAAMAEANAGAARPYGADPATGRLEALVTEVFEKPAKVFLVSTGTSANALALACLCPPWATVYCHQKAHVEEDECGAPEFYTGGAKLTLLRGEAAKIAPDALADALRFTARAGVHNVQKGALSLTQATELGAAYTPDEVAALAGMAKAAGVPVHMDGTRFANALARLGCAPADLTWRAGVDALCLGATKNGAICAEAVILFEGGAAHDRAWEFELRRKRGGHLWSKMRFMSAQMEAYLTDGLWLRLAGRANAMADRLAAGLRAIPGVEIAAPMGANMMFPRFPRRGHRALQDAGALYYLWPGDQSLDGPDDEPLQCRLVCSWATTEAEVDAFVATLSGALAAKAA